MFRIRKTAFVALALVAAGYVLGDDINAYASFMMSGGPPGDAVPVIPLDNG
jgi:hypothetical protein